MLIQFNRDGASLLRKIYYTYLLRVRQSNVQNMNDEKISRQNMLCRWRYLIPEFPETCACVTACATTVRHIRSLGGQSKVFWYTYRLDIYIVYTLYMHCIYICVRTPTLHESSLALAALRRWRARYQLRL